MSSSGCPTEKDTREQMKETEALLRFSESICICSLRKGGRAEAGGESNSSMDEECLLISLPLLQAKKKKKRMPTSVVRAVTQGTMERGPCT